MTSYATDFADDDVTDFAADDVAHMDDGAGADPAALTPAAALTEADAPFPTRSQSPHRHQTLEHQTSNYQTLDYQTLDYRRLAALIDQARDQAGEGGFSPAASDAQKWQAGDLVGAMGRAVADARDRLLDPVIPVTPAAHAAYRMCAAAYDEFLGVQGLSRGTLVDAGLTAATFPPSDPIRLGPLSFSHARTLTRLRSGAARSAWAARAIREGLSVARLQTLLNIEGPHIEKPHIEGPHIEKPYIEKPSGAGFAHSEGAEQVTNPEYPPRNGRISRRPRPRHRHVCTFTGVPIADLSSLVEVRLDPEAAEGFDLSAVAQHASPRGGASLPGPNGSPPQFPLLLRFAGLSALARWLASCRVGGSDGGGSDGNASF